MRRLLAMLLALTCLFLSGCGGTQNEETGTPVVLYYETKGVEDLSAGTAVSSETRYLSTLSLQELLDIYMSGPKAEELTSPFPAGARVLDMIPEEDALTLIMSGEYFTLVGVELSVANCCLASTICAYTGLESVMLMDEMKTIQMDIHPDHYLLRNNISDENNESFTVYFSDLEHRYVIAETRDVTLSENETDMAYVMRELFEGPDSGQLLGIIPRDTELLGISQEDGLCTVNFSREFYTNRFDNSYGAYTTIYGITNTLTSLPEIEAVQFLVEGEPVPSYGIFSLTEPVTRNVDAIGPVRTASGEIDVNVYVLNVESGESFAVPCRVKQTISKPLAEAVASRVLSYEAFQGFYNPIPYGVELLNISVSGNVCYVDLSERFVPQEDSEQAEREAVWSLVTSLTDLDGISSVVLSLNNESGGLTYVDISEPLTRKNVALD